MASNRKTILDLVNGMFSKPKKGTIVRFHKTKAENVPSILENGLEPRFGGGFQDDIGDEDRMMNAVFTSVRAPIGAMDSRYWDALRKNGWTIGSYRPFDTKDVSLRIEIPKEEYRNLDRADVNAEIEDKYVKGMTDLEYVDPDDKDLQSVLSGGRTDIFYDRLNPEWIKNALCVDDDLFGNPYDCTEEFRIYMDNARRK